MLSDPFEWKLVLIFSNPFELMFENVFVYFTVVYELSRPLISSSSSLSLG